MAKSKKREPLPASWAEDLAKSLMAPEAPKGDGVTGVIARNDREMLGNWWREELASIEASMIERRALLEAAGEHPSELVAREVLAAGARGIPKDVACVLLGMTERALERFYGAEYAAGCAEVIARAAQNMMRIAASTNDRYAVKALTEFLNRRGGQEWRAPAQKLEVENVGKPRSNVIDSSKLSYEDRQALKAIIERTMTRGVGVAGQIESDDDDA